MTSSALSAGSKGGRCQQAGSTPTGHKWNDRGLAATHVRSLRHLAEGAKESLSYAAVSSGKNSCSMSVLIHIRTIPIQTRA